MAHGFNTRFLFLALMALAVASCANNDNEVRSKNLRTILDYSSAVQKQSMRWGELNKIWDQLIKKKCLYGLESNQDFLHINSIEIYITL